MINIYTMMRFSSLRARKSSGEILSGNHRLLRHKTYDAIQLRILNNLEASHSYATKVLSILKTRLLITKNRLAFMLPIGSGFV